MTIISQNPSDHATQLLILTERLTDLIHAEVEALRNRDLAASSYDWSEKEKLAHSYRMEIARLNEYPELLSGISEIEKNRLRQATTNFQNALADHSVALNAMKELSEGLVQAIAHELGSTHNAPAQYGASGQVSDKTAISGLAVNAQV